MRISKQARREAKELFRSCQTDGRLNADRVRQAVALVLDRQPRGYLAMLTHFQRLVRLDVARRSGRVDSAVPLEPNLRARLAANLERIYGPGLDLQYGENTELIGGVRIRVGSDVYDDTVQGRLAAVERAFSS